VISGFNELLAGCS